MAVYPSQHPLVKHKVSLLRQSSISTKDFRELANEIASMLTIEASQTMDIADQTINCWSGPVSVPLMANKQPTLVPILRAGLGMLSGALAILPCAKVSIVGMARNEETLQPESYYQNIVGDISERQAIVIDPMLATGGSALATIDLLKASGCNKIKALFLVAAPEGIDKLIEHHPDVDIHVGAIDIKLNEQGYIIPGLGDAGDKLFGTL
jgi:uracil phosphoribosyltransferase